jgi:branched-chain amino acid transport system substrate-binding protein
MSRIINGRLRTVAVLATLALAAAACGSSKKATSTTGTTAAGGSGGSSGPHVKIGFFGALTGPNAQLGLNEFNGAKLAVDQYNKKGKTQVDLQKYDSQGDPAQAPQLAQKVIADKTVALVGPAFSGESKAADPIFEQAAIVNITPSATGPKLAENGWKYFHRAVGNDNSQGPAAAKYIEKKLKAKTVAVIDDNEEYSLGIADIVRTTLKKDGVNVVVSDHIDKNAQDYSATVNKIKPANVDAIFYGGYYSEGGRFLKQLRDAGIKAPWVSDDGAEDQKLVDSAGASAAEGAVMTIPSGDITANPDAKTFVADYTASAGSAPGAYSGEGYDAANLILQAVGAGKTTGKDINDFLSTVSYKGLTKTFKFDSKGEVSTATIYVYGVKNAKVGFIGSVDQLTAG